MKPGLKESKGQDMFCLWTHDTAKKSAKRAKQKNCIKSYFVGFEKCVTSAAIIYFYFGYRQHYNDKYVHIFLSLLTDDWFHIVTNCDINK